MSSLSMESNMSSQTPLKNHTLQAVAGAGKTRHLIEEVFQVLETHIQKKEKTPRIIITTFTRKATQEVKERMMTRAIQNKNWDLLKLLFDPSQIQISTLHGILFSFLKKYVLQQNFDFIDSFQAQFLSRSIVRDLFLKNPSFYQFLQFYSFNDICEMCAQYDTWIRQEPSLQFLTSREIQNNWIEHIKKILNSFSQKNHPTYLKMKENPFTLHKEDLKGVQLKDFRSEESFEKFKEFKKNLETHHPQNAQMFEENYKLFKKLAEDFKNKWSEIKKKKSYLQIEDLELLALESFRKNPDHIHSFSKEWDEWYIDEYQDTSLVQENLLNQLCQNARRVWTAGDPQQSIYFFRNAEPEVFYRRKKLESFEEKTVNFRSSPELISFFNNFFKKSQSSFLPMQSPTPKQDSTQTPIQDQTLKQDSIQNSTQTPMQDSKKNHKHVLKNPPKELKAVAHFLQYSDAATQNEVIALRLNEILKENISGENICILVTRNEDVKTICDFLKKLKFPVQPHSSETLTRHILDLIFLLRFLIQPLDNQNLIGLLRTPFFFLKDDHIASLVKKMKENKNYYLWWGLKKENHPVVESLKELIETSSRIGYSEALLYFLEKHSLMNLSFYQDPTGEYEHQVWELLENLKEQERKPQFQYSRFVDQILNKTKFHHPDRSSSQTGVIRSGFIQVMTIHQSKGLEFDYIILPNLERNLKIPAGTANRFSCQFKQKRWSFYLKNSKSLPIYPLEQRVWNQEKNEKEFIEKDRLFYVAMTRAKKNLTFIYPKNEDSKNNTWLSRFPYFKDFHEQDSLDLRELKEIPHQTCTLQTPLLSQPLSPHLKPSLLQKEEELKNKIPLKLSIFEGISRGVSLHQHLQILSKKGDSFLNQVQDSKIKQALIFVKNIKEPPLQELLKQQKAEWGFVLKEKDFKLTSGRMDLWGEIHGHIWVIDYKSSEKFSIKTWEQLEFYARVLKKIFPQKPISMCAIHPFSEEVKIRSYQK